MTITRKSAFKVGIALLLAPVVFMGLLLLSQPHSYDRLIAFSGSLLKIRLAIIFGICLLIIKSVRQQPNHVRKAGTIAVCAFLIFAVGCELMIGLG